MQIEKNGQPATIYRILQVEIGYLGVLAEWFEHEQYYNEVNIMFSMKRVLMIGASAAVLGLTGAEVWAVMSPSGETAAEAPVAADAAPAPDAPPAVPQDGSEAPQDGSETPEKTCEESLIQVNQSIAMLDPLVAAGSATPEQVTEYQECLDFRQELPCYEEEVCCVEETAGAPMGFGGGFGGGGGGSGGGGGGGGFGALAGLAGLAGLAALNNNGNGGNVLATNP